ncbi:pentapeptide repeat-containing protein [Streptomyces sp. JV180]|uniref:pentapeptide repeat-containing protein n=1 Tax=Streptomyces sp. JV180 TaxID=858634 RepID=UPI00168BEBBE|nr:pentapeptide repeat-containing protein [Streptomyces sp. JV180]MBD3545573.1 pentapeptide repeat-containing protein [Streptomyces sp. JV180]
MQPKAKYTLYVLASAAAVIVYAALLWRGPWWIDGAHLRTSNLEPADGVVITGFRTTLVALGAGAIATMGLYYTHRAHQQTRQLFDHTRSKDREQVDLMREGQVTERYVEAIKLLSSENLTQQLGGIYALERIMQDSEKDRRTVIEVLAAFIREAPKVSESGETDGSQAKARPNLAAIQAALVVLSKRPDPESGFTLENSDLDNLNAVHLNLRNVYLRYASLNNLSAYEVDLRGAFLRHASLSGANLEGANLDGTYLRYADLTHTYLRRASMTDAELQGADLTDSELDVESLVKAKLTSTTLLPPDLQSDERVRFRIQECEKEQHNPDRSS